MALHPQVVQLTLLSLTPRLSASAGCRTNCNPPTLRSPMPRRLRRRGQICAAAPSQRITFLDKCFERHPDGVQVFGHRPGGVVVTPGCNSFDYSFVFLVRLFLATCNKIECLGLPCQRFTDIDDYRLEDPIPTGFCNQSVKLGVECNPYERIVLVTHLLYQSAEGCQFLRGVPLGSPSCGRNFDMRPCFDQFVGRVTAEIEVSRYRITDDKRAEPGFCLGEPESVARAQGFADNRSTDPVPFGQGRFGRETLSDCQIAGGYCGTKVCEDCLGSTHPRGDWSPGGPAV